VSLVERARRVLVVDDDAHIVELIVTRLGIAGFETHVARNGHEAIQRLSEFRPEAMVLDINMPILDGFGVLAHMQANGLSAKIPTMVLTARNNAGDVARAVKMGARDYLSKPFNDTLLVQRVGRLLSRPRAAA
jgi:DNA-binding response OmpR family regulator